MDAYSLSANSSLQLLNEISFTTPGINTQCNLNKLSLGASTREPEDEKVMAERRNKVVHLYEGFAVVVE